VQLKTYPLNHSLSSSYPQSNGWLSCGERQEWLVKECAYLAAAQRSVLRGPNASGSRATVLYRKRWPVDLPVLRTIFRHSYVRTVT